MSLSKRWARKHGLTMVQRKQLEIELLMEKIAAQEEQRLFDEMERTKTRLQQIDDEWRDYVVKIEAMIAEKHRFTAEEWEEIKLTLKRLADERKELTYGPFKFLATQGVRSRRACACIKAPWYTCTCLRSL